MKPRAVALLSWMLHRPWLMLAILLLITAAAVVALGRLEINSTPYMIDKSHPSRMADAENKRLFSNTGEQAFVALENPQGNIFNPGSLQRVAELTRAFQAIEMVLPGDSDKLRTLAEDPRLQADVEAILEGGLTPADQPRLAALKQRLAEAGELSHTQEAWLDSLHTRLVPIRKVRSLVTIENLLTIDEALDVHPLMPQVPTDPAGLDALRAEAMGNPLFLDSLVSRDGSATTIQVEFNIAQDDSPAMLQVYQAIVDITDKVQGDDRIYLSGPPMIAAQTASNMEKDNQTLLPAVLLVILLVLFVSFGRVQGVVAPLLIAIFSLIWTLGLMAACGVKQNIITSIMPVFIISIAVCDAIHFLADYYRNLPPNPDRQARIDTAFAVMQQLFWPMFVTCMTTLVGFFSLIWTDVTFIREFGIFTGFGIFFAWLITIVFLPAIVILWKAEPPRHGLLVSDRLDRMIATLGHFARYGRRLAFGMLVAIVLCSWYVVENLTIDNQVIGYFEQDSRIRQDDAAINAKFGGTTPISIMIESDRADAFKDPAVIEGVARLQEHLRQQQLVGFTYSPADFVKRLHQVTQDTFAAEQYRLPDDISASLLAQYYLLYENANGRDLFDVVDRRFQSGRVLAILHTDRSSEVGALMRGALDYAREVLPAGMSVRVSGYGEVLVATTDAVVWGQVNSILSSPALIVLMVMAMFHSVRLGFVALLPLLFTLVGISALMALSGTDLDIGTSIIAAISFGIGIDYAIHVIAAMRHSPGSAQQATQYALRHTGKPILINTLALGLGFLVLCLSGYQSLVNLGIFISLTMLFSALFALLVLPVFVRTRQQPEAAAQLEPANA
ncbi:MMPL family transporter [Pseudomonas sp. BLCC-B13]|uniref:efflux RND transporter permease subunit n=1 Tax=Pseudomonas sp. BLCC-B13 TaxID=3025314 RepID=UPI00234F0062|nr:MMPL family transporter [Pseudomonas sp. BLCC-B13]MDC7823582.1 MMPL family transporter [Pseudomonas sp. BLCC-B13]